MFTKLQVILQKKSFQLLLVFTGLLFLFFFVASQTKLTTTNTLVPTPTNLPSPTSSPSPIPTLIPTAIPLPTSTPTPLPSPTPLPNTSYDEYFDKYSSQYNVSKDLLKKIALCESGANPGARNGIYGGIFQFSIDTWVATRKQMGADENPDLRFQAEESIKTAAYKIGNGGQSAWTNCL